MIKNFFKHLSTAIQIIIGGIIVICMDIYDSIKNKIRRKP